MVVLGVDAHKRTHTVVAVDQLGRKLGERTTGTTSQDHLGLLRWAEKFGHQRLWAVEDAGTCRAGWSATCSAPASGSCACRPS
jgi:hypothetical protein